MEFTKDLYPKYAIRLKSGPLASCLLGGSDEKAAIFFATEPLAHDWLQDEFRDEEAGASVIELDEFTWWHTLRETPQRLYMAFVTEDTSVVFTTSKVLQAFIDLAAQIGAEHLEPELDSAMRGDDMDLIQASIAAVNNPTLQRVLAAIKASIELCGTVTPAHFVVDRKANITFQEYDVFDALQQNQVADLLVSVVREGNHAVGILVGVRESEQGEMSLECFPCVPDLVQVFYEELDLALYCQAEIQRAENQLTVSQWIFGASGSQSGSRFHNIFAKASALGPPPATRDEMAAEMRRDLATFARQKGITEPITFEDLSSHCYQPEIERLLAKWTWQINALSDGPPQDYGTEEERAKNFFPWKFWEGTIDPGMS